MIRALWTASFLLLVGCGPQSFEASSDAPNILLVVTDDLGWGDLGFRGSPAQTPHLDRLSEEGALLNRCYAQPLCTPTRVALLTGNMPVRYGLQYRPLRPWDRHGLPKSASLLPEKLQAAGYQTALIGKWHLGHGAPEHHPLRRGFDSFYGMMTGAHDYWTHERGGALDWQRNGSSLHEEGYSTTLLGLEAERFVRRAGERSQPWFLYLAFNAPHTPLQAPQERVDRLTGIVGERRATYLAMVEEMDAALGRVLSALDETKQTKETLVVFLNDNGGARIEGATNKPLRGGKGTAFEGGIRVPGIVRWPNSIPAGNHEQLIHPTDWTPTLLTAAGATVSADEFDGENLLEALQTNHPVSKSNQFFGTISEYGWFLAIIDGETKYVRRTLNDGRSFERLFDLSTDLGEDNDLSKEQPDTLARLATLADAWHALSPSGDPFMISEAPEGWTPPTDWADASRPEEALLHSANPPRPLHQKPNFVLIVADDLGVGDLGYLGGEMQTPHMDALAGQGLRFERFYSWALCTPSRAALLTGQDPMSLGLAWTPLRPADEHGLPAATTTIAQELQGQGYRTACVGKWHLGHHAEEQHPHQKGFEHFYGCLHGAIDYESHKTRNGERDWQRNGKALVEKGYSTRLFAQEAAQWIQQLPKDEPFFLYLPFNAPHLPLQAPQETIRKYMNLPVARRVFCAMVHELDVAVGHVVEALESKGVAENTWILFVSDNGAGKEDGGSNAELRGAKGSAYEGGLRVPAFLAHSSLQESTVSIPASVLDFAPTLRELAGLPPDPKALGHSLLNLPNEARTFQFAARNEQWTNFARIVGDHKYLRRESRTQDLVRERVFDLAQDPSEELDLADSSPSFLLESRAAIAAWRADDMEAHPVQSGPSRPLKD